MDIARTPYSGPSRKLVVALDIGTTFSGAAYSLLDPGEVPQIQSVTRQVFPPISELVTNGDERVRYPNTPNLGSAKIPSVLYYDHDGGFRGVENGVDSQDDDEFLKMAWWEVIMFPPFRGTDGTPGGS